MGDFIEGFVPGDGGEIAFAFGAGAAEGVEQTVGGVFVIEVAGYFAAEEAAGDGVVGVAAETAAVILLVDIDEERAGVGAIEGADGVDGAGHGVLIISDGAISFQLSAFSYQLSAISFQLLPASPSAFRLRLRLQVAGTVLPSRFLSYIVTAGNQFLFWLPAVSESGGIYKNPLPEGSLLQRHVLVKDLPHLSPCPMRSAATGMCKFRCSPSGHQACVLRLTWSSHARPPTARTLALAQIDLNCVLPSTLTLRRGEPQFPLV